MIRSAVTGTLHFAEHALGRTVIGFLLWAIPPKNARLLRHRR